MKFKLVAPLSLLMLSTACQARIGETLAECTARYGQPVNSDKEMSLFTKGGFGLAVWFFEGKADALCIIKQKKNEIVRGEELSETEIEQLLKAYGGRGTWKKVKEDSMAQSWATQDNDLSARYTKFDHDLTILTKGRELRIEAEDKAREARDDEWLKATAQSRAVAKYPALAVKDSPLNREFLRRYHEYQRTRKEFFNDPEWPTKLAQEASDAIKH